MTRPAAVTNCALRAFGQRARQVHWPLTAFAVHLLGERIGGQIFVNLSADPALRQNPDNAGTIGMHYNGLHREFLRDWEKRTA